jgi:hypothetical protein
MNNEQLDRILEKSLASEPGFKLPVDFASKLTQAAVRREQWKIDLREYFLYSAVVFVLAAIVGGFYYFINPNLCYQAFNFVLKNWMQVIAAVLLLNFIFFADKVLLRLLFNRWNLKG